ncbi:phage tail length tape measure family protein [Fulvimonas yonginensis]|uniref:Phage tail length tape measure family protein n=1 Tax=Fulvimonas yonginensis TaxID=1495200 RepID=A0ABU8JB49_9GAMM
MNDRNLDIALRIKADLAEGRKGLQAIGQSIEETGKKAESTNTSLARTGQRFDSLLGSVDRVVRVLENIDTRMAAMATSSVQVAKATEQVSAGTQAAVDGVRRLAETEEEAAARIRAVIAASRDQVASQEASAAAAREAATQARGHSDAAEDVSASVARQNAQMRQASVSAAEAAAAERQAAGAAQDHAAELTRLLGQIDPTIAALERLDAQEAELQRYRSMGLVDPDSFARFQGQIETSRQSLSRMGVTSAQTAMAMRQLPAQISDITVSLAAGMPVWMVFLQQGSQIKDSFGGAKPALEGVLSVLTPLRLAIGGVVGAVALLTAAAVEGYLENERLARAIITTGNYAGTTTGQVDQLAAAYGSVNGRVGQARQILNGLIDTGRVSAETLNEVGRAAVNMAALGGKSAQQVVSEFSRLADDPVRAAIELDRQYHFLNTTLLQQIQTLQRAGDQYGAVNLAAKAFADETGRRMDELHERMGWLETFADKWSRGVDNIKQGLLDLGKPATEIEKFQAALAKYNKVYDAYRRSLTAGSTKEYQDQLFAQSQQAYRELQAAQQEALQVRTDAAAQGVAQQVQTEGKAAAEAIDKLTTSLDRAKQRQDALNEAAENLYKIHLAGGKLPEGVNFEGPQADMPQGPGWDRLKKAIEQRYADPKSSNAGAREAEAQARAAAAAQQGLLQSLQQMQGQLDPAAAAWVKYNQAVAQANEQAAQAKKAPGADTRAIEAERVAVIGLAKTIRDAELDKLAEQDRQAWEQLRQSLRTPTEASVETAEAQIKQLNDLLAKGVINAQQYHDSIHRIGESSVITAPQYQGVDASVGGVSSELSKNFEAQRALDEWHAQQLAANEAFRAEDEANEEAYQARKATIEQQYADQRLNIEQSRHQLSLTASSDFFGQLAVLQQSSNRKIATIGKAAAIAKAMIDTYQSATAAYAAMASIPYVGPALGAAAAAAAIAAGLANVAQIRSQPTGYATGGEIRGAGTATSDSIPIMASNGEFMQRTAAVDYYGLDFMHAVNNLEFPRYADGGAIGDAPRLSAPPAPTMRLSSALSTREQGNGRDRAQKHVHVWDRNQAAQEIAGTDAFEEAVLHVVGSNPTTIQGRWNS